MCFVGVQHVQAVLFFRGFVALGAFRTSSRGGQESNLQLLPPRYMRLLLEPLHHPATHVHAVNDASTQYPYWSNQAFFIFLLLKDVSIETCGNEVGESQVT